MESDQALDAKASIYESSGFEKIIKDDEKKNIIDNLDILIEIVEKENSVEAYSYLGELILKYKIQISDDLKNLITEKAISDLYHFYTKNGEQKISMANLMKNYDNINGKFLKKKYKHFSKNVYHNNVVENEIDDICEIGIQIPIPKEIFEKNIYEIFEKLEDPTDFQVFGYMLMECGAEMDEDSFNIILDGINDDDECYWNNSPERKEKLEIFRNNVINYYNTGKLLTPLENKGLLEVMFGDK